MPAPLAGTVGTSQLLPDGFARVGRAVQVLLGVSGIASLAAVGFELWRLAVMRTAATDDFAALNRYGETQGAVANAVGESMNAGAAVFAILVVGDLTRRAVTARDDAVAESELR